MSNNRGHRRGASHARFYARWAKYPALKTLSGNGWLLLFLLDIEYRPGHPNIWHMTDQKAALLLGCSPATAGKTVRALIERGFLREERAGGIAGPVSQRSRYVSLSWYPTAARRADESRLKNWKPTREGDT